MIRVYKVRRVPRDFQYLMEDRKKGHLSVGGWGCQSLQACWSPPEVYIFRPLLEPTDFYQWMWDTLVTSPRATEALRPHLEVAGELLPLPFEGQTLTVLNVTQCVDCLDDEATVWSWNDDRSYRGAFPKDYVFDPDRLPTTTTVFKIPQTRFGELLVVEGLRKPEDEFRYAVKQAKLRGLEFILLWEHKGLNEP